MHQLQDWKSRKVDVPLQFQSLIDADVGKLQDLWIQEMKYFNKLKSQVCHYIFYNVPNTPHTAEHTCSVCVTTQMVLRNILFSEKWQCSLMCARATVLKFISGIIIYACFLSFVPHFRGGRPSNNKKHVIDVSKFLYFMV